MILTGKAKEDFENWIYKGFGLSIEEFNNRHSSDSNHIIIEWLDSLGIYIEISVYTNQLNKIAKFSYTIYGIYPHGNFEIFSSRQEAITEAIKQANKIYNDQKI